MRRLVSGWTESARAVGGALLEVWRAEADALGRDFKRSGRELRGVLVLSAVAAGVGFWTVGLGLWAGVEALSEHLPRWGAVAAVLGAGLLATLLLLLIARRRLRRVEPPLRLVKRHGREHVEWWRETFEGDGDGTGTG